MLTLPRHEAGHQKKEENSLLSVFSQGCCPWKAAPQLPGPGLHFSWEKAPAGSAQQGSSLVISECVTVAPPTLPVLLWELPANPDPKFLFSQLNKLLLLTGHTHRSCTKLFLLTHLCRTSQPLPRNALGAGHRHSHTHWAPIRAPGSQQETDGTKPIKSRLRPCPTQVWTGCH